MPAPCEVVFDIFHYQHWRSRWDSLVDATSIAGGAPCPYVGAINDVATGGMLSGLSMRTQFVSYQRPRMAAAKMVGRSFPFTKWAASMKHEKIDAEQSVMIYTYTIETGPPLLRWLMEPIVSRIFLRQTRKRFACMCDFLLAHRAEVEAWQRSYHVSLNTN
ncbi:MAG: SRPBCC family protein [Pseudomonadota bacterium]